MIKYFKRKGIDQISVNTQDNNTSSLALYKRLGFELTGETFPVFRYKI
jgi:ribosomal protein S18 acetylase RimI-like enzyme